MIPDWAPNIHPMLVHFPIALLFAAVLLDVAALFVRKLPSLRVSAVVVFALGALGAVASFLTGRMAADTVILSGDAQALLTDHADWAQITVWFFGIYALIRVGVLRLDLKDKIARWVPVALTVIGAGGLVLVWQTGERGARMVFQRGVGVQAVTGLQERLEAQQEAIDRADAIAAGPISEEDGSWKWIPNEFAPGSLVEAFDWFEGDTTMLAPRAVPREEGGYTLRLDAQGGPTFFVYDQPLTSLQADVTLNLDGFDGVVDLAYNVKDAANYHFLEIAADTIRQGFVAKGTREILEEGTFSGARWQQIRVVSDEGHFRGYVGGTLVTHAHGAEPGAGTFGLRIDGEGTLLLDRIAVQSIRPGAADDDHDEEAHDEVEDES